MYMIMFVLDNTDQLDEVLGAWEAVGVSGITFMESSGFHRRMAHLLGARYVFTLPELVDRVEKGSYTLFAVVPDLQIAQQCCTATEQVVGNLDDPNTGVIAAWEIAFGKGIAKRGHTTEVGA